MVAPYKFEKILNIVCFSMKNNFCGVVRVSVVPDNLAVVPNEPFTNIPNFALNKRKRHERPLLICLIIG